jgi:MFS family permease
MYQVEATSALRLPAGRLRSAGRVIGPNVIALGLTSFFTDISSEMITTVLPIYLVLHVGLSPLQFGFLDGLYHGLTAVFRLVSGVAADRWRRHKEIAAVGYGLSAACKLAMTAAGAALPLLAAIVAVDRFGKGVRTAPRDALISLSTTKEHVGFAFGVHRAFDSAGAMLGPICAIAVLAALPDRYDVVFLASFAVAMMGLAVLGLFVENVPRLAADATIERATRSRWRSGAMAGMRPLLAAATLLSAASISDGFVYLLLQQKQAVNVGLFPILYVGTAAWFLIIAVPAGRIADRIGRHATLLAGHGALALAYLVAALAPASTPTVVACLFLLGTYYAMTDGVLMALAGNAVPAAHAATAMAALTTLTSTGRFIAAVGFGALWSMYGATAAAMVFAVALAAAIAAAGMLVRAPHKRETVDGD